MTEHLRWPPDRFYWAVLDASVLPGARAGRRARVSSRRLGYLLERCLPGLPIEDMHAVYEPMPGPGRRYVACGAARETLANAVQDAVTLSPEQLPPFIEADIDPARLNLLTGPFVPNALVAARSRWALITIAALLLTASVLAAGLERRRSVLLDEVAQIGDARMLVYEEVLGPGVLDSVGTAFPPELQLVAELRQLEETRSGPDLGGNTGDCAVVLGHVLARWPPGLHAQTESLSVTARSVSLQGRVPSMAEAQSLASALAGVDGWRVTQPQTESRDDGVQFTLRLERASSASTVAAEGAP